MERPGLLTQKGNSEKTYTKNPRKYLIFSGVFIFVLFTYYFFLNIKFIKNKITIAPIAPVKIEPINPSPREMCNTLPRSQYPTLLPRIPIMIFPISPNPLPL